MTDKQQRILNAIGNGNTTTADIYRATQVPFNTIRGSLTKLRARGKVVNTGAGWALPGPNPFTF